MSPMQSPEALPTRNPAVLDRWIFSDRESVEQEFGMEMEKVKEMYKSDVGRKELLEQMKQLDPTLNGEVESVMAVLNQNIEQLEKKESFFGKMIKLPVRAVQSVGRTMKKHPYLTAGAGIAALLALLYFTTPLAPTIGAYGQYMIDSFKSVMGKLGVPTSDVAVDAVAQVPVTGGAVDPLIMQEAAAAAQSPGAMSQMTTELLQSASQAVEAGAGGAINATPMAPSLIPGAGNAVQTIDPLQRALQGLPQIAQ